MAGITISQHPKAFHSSLQIFSSLKMPSSSTRALIHTVIASYLRRIFRALASAKSFLVKVLRKRSSSHRPVHFFIYFTRNKKNKIHFGSFRLHYNWCSSRCWSVPTTVLAEFPASSHVYYDSTWQCEEVMGADMFKDTKELTGYLQWLEEKKVNGDLQPQSTDRQGSARNEIDELADMFIAQCREKFILEKQESDRRFHEMLARSM